VTDNERKTLREILKGGIDEFSTKTLDSLTDGVVIFSFKLDGETGFVDCMMLTASAYSGEVCRQVVSEYLNDQDTFEEDLKAADTGGMIQ
jgi:hypothetical protein